MKSATKIQAALWVYASLTVVALSCLCMFGAGIAVATQARMTDMMNGPPDMMIRLIVFCLGLFPLLSLSLAGMLLALAIGITYPFSGNHHDEDVRFAKTVIRLANPLSLPFLPFWWLYCLSRSGARRQKDPQFASS